MDTALQHGVRRAIAAIELRNVSKRYANGTLANSDVNLRVERGEIHAIVGENGAGKSTVMKMLYGLEQPSGGDILLDGDPICLRSPRDAIAAGIGLVPQHLQLIGSFTVAQNIVLGCEPMRGPLVDRRHAAETVAAVAARFGLQVDPHAQVAGLSVGEQQRVEILKTLYRGARVLLLDEPSAVLTPQEAQALFRALRTLVAAGLTIVLITHKLAEVREVSDRFTVMRGGKVTGQAESRDARDAEIGEMIVGRTVAPLAVSRVCRRAEPAQVAVRGLTLRGSDGRMALDGVSFDIAAGEILGIAGVEGNGQDALVEVLSGMRRPTGGTARLDGQKFADRGVRAARAQRVAVIPEDRLRNGVAAEMSITENLIATAYHQPPYSRLGWLDVGAARGASSRMLADYGVVARSPDDAIGLLSGGNMQKVVLAREVAGAPRLLIASQPTRGVDIGASRFLRQQLIDLRDDGAAVLLLSADLDEVLALSDRIAVMFRGRVVAHFAADADAVTVGLYMTGLRAQDGASGVLDAPFTEDGPGA